MKRAALYCRVSTIDQHPENQLREIRQFTPGQSISQLYNLVRPCGLMATQYVLLQSIGAISETQSYNSRNGCRGGRNPSEVEAWARKRHAKVQSTRECQAASLASQMFSVTDQ
jgi:hypothetical protein